MKFKPILFSALISAGVGAVFGLAVDQIAPSPYQSRTYSTLKRNYPLIGAIGGFLGGGVIAAVHLRNEQYERQE